MPEKFARAHLKKNVRAKCLWPARQNPGHCQTQSPGKV